MNAKTGFIKVWAALDYLLLVAVFILLAVVWYSDWTGMARVRQDASPDAESKAAGRKSAVRPVDGIRVANGPARLKTIAQSMVATDWDQAPPSPAMDMREEGKMYEVTFPLPEGVARDSVRVTAAGNVLTLTMKDGHSGKIFMQRISVPCACACGGEHADNVQSVVSNDVLHVRVIPFGG